MVLSARGGKLEPTAVFSNCWTTGDMESLCSAGERAFEVLAVGAGASVIVRC